MSRREHLWEHMPDITCPECGADDARWCPDEWEMGFVRVVGGWECQECGHLYDVEG